MIFPTLAQKFISINCICIIYSHEKYCSPAERVVFSISWLHLGIAPRGAEDPQAEFGRGGIDCISIIWPQTASGDDLEEAFESPWDDHRQQPSGIDTDVPGTCVLDGVAKGWMLPGTTSKIYC